MDFLKKAKVVRFRSHHNKYLLAYDDEASVWQNGDGTIKNSRWTVELISEDSNTLRLKSCFGKYLTALTTQECLGIKCNRVLQTVPKTLDSLVEWEPVREGYKVKLKTADGQFLRANGCSIPPWKDSVTHDIPRRSSAKDCALWDVDIVEMRDQQQEQEQTSIKNDDNSTQEPLPEPEASVSRSGSSQTQPGSSPAEVDLSSPEQSSPSDKKKV